MDNLSYRVGRCCVVYEGEDFVFVRVIREGCRDEYIFSLVMKLGRYYWDIWGIFKNVVNCGEMY